MRLAALVLLALTSCRPKLDPVGECAKYRSTPGTCTRSEISESPVEDPLLVRVRFAYAWDGAEQTTAPPREFDWIIPRSRLAALREPSRDKHTLAAELPAVGHVVDVGRLQTLCAGR